MPLRDFLQGSSPEDRTAKQREHEEQLPDLIKRANQLEEAAITKLFEDDFYEAYQLFGKARELYLEWGYPDGVAETDLHLALLLEEKFDLPEDALRLYREAVRLYREGGNEHGEITALLELAPCYLHLGKRSEAKECYDRASLLAERTGDAGARERIIIESRAVDAHYIASSDQLCVERALADAIRDTQEPRYLGAFRLLLENRRYYTEVSEIKRLKWVRAELEGLIEDRVAALPPREAVAFFEQAVEVCRQLDSRDYETQMLLRLASAYRSLDGHEHRARQCFEQAATLAEALAREYQQADAKYDEVMVTLDLALCYYGLGEHDKVQQCFERAQTLAQLLEDSRVMARVLSRMVTYGTK